MLNWLHVVLMAMRCVYKCLGKHKSRPDIFIIHGPYSYIKDITLSRNFRRGWVGGRGKNCTPISPSRPYLRPFLPGRPRNRSPTSPGGSCPPCTESSSQRCGPGGPHSPAAEVERMPCLGLPKAFFYLPHLHHAICHKACPLFHILNYAR